MTESGLQGKSLSNYLDSYISPCNGNVFAHISRYSMVKLLRNRRRISKPVTSWRLCSLNT